MFLSILGRGFVEICKTHKSYRKGCLLLGPNINSLYDSHKLWNRLGFGGQPLSKYLGALSISFSTTVKQHYQRTDMKGEIADSNISKPIENVVRKKLTNCLQPAYLEILNESYMHSVPAGSETHFKIVVVSDVFNDVSLIKRHRIVHDILKDELQNDVHALSIVAKTPSQWENSEKLVSPSPACRGGFGK